MTTTLLLGITSLIIYYFVFFKKELIFGFKESFLAGLFVYTLFPLLFILFNENFLKDNFPLFKGFDTKDIIKAQYLILITLISFFIGYFLLNRKKKIFNLKQDFNLVEIIFAIFIFSITIFFRIEHTQPNIIIFILICLIIFKSNSNDRSKIFYTIIFTLLFMVFSIYWSPFRRDIIKILIITFFFISFFSVKTKNFYLLIIVLTVVSFFSMVALTYSRTELDLSLSIDLKSFVANYDIFPAFENFIYIISNDIQLNDKTLFKIFYSWIPREIWEVKPIDTNRLIIDVRTNSFVGGTSAAITLLGEVYWNYGDIGVITFFILLGIIAKKFDSLDKNKFSDFELILFSSYSYLIFMMWRGSISTTLIIYLVNILLLIMSLLLAKLLFRIPNK